MKMKGYLWVDLKRAFQSFRFLGGVLGIWIALLLGSYVEKNFKQQSTSLEALEQGIYGITGLIILMISSFPYAGSFCEDIENRYLFSECIRGDYKSFTKSRVVIIFCSSVVTMACGILGYTVYVKIRYGLWWSPESMAYQSLCKMGSWYVGMLRKTPILYFGAMGCLYGMLAGILSLLAALLSLYFANKLLIMSVPFLFMYLILNLSMLSDLWDGKLNIWYIYQPFYGCIDTDVKAYLYAVSFTAVTVYFLYRMILMRVNRRIHYA